DEWCDLLDGWSGHTQGHTAIAIYLQDVHGVDGWWAQAVTVGYERITGLRLQYQQPDGTYTANKTRTVSADPKALRALLLDDTDRADLFPGIETELRSRPVSKVIRIGIGGGVAQIGVRTSGRDESQGLDHPRAAALSRGCGKVEGLLVGVVGRHRRELRPTTARAGSCP
ncbi:MAG: hypothetical protein ACRDWH_11885, partial [Acidimicrobiia bacterium]